jgi:hypothetical protein
MMRTAIARIGKRGFPDAETYFRKTVNPTFLVLISSSNP